MRRSLCEHGCASAKQGKNGKRGERKRAWQKHGCSSGLGAASVDAPHFMLPSACLLPNTPSPSRRIRHRATVLALPACAVIAPGLRALLSEGAPATEPALRDPLDVMATTLELLTLLGADGEVIAAAILHACPTWRGNVRNRLDQAHPAVAALLDGQAAATQVWALHAAHRDDRNQEGLRRLLLAIVRDLRVIPILLSRQLARLRFAARLPEAERRALAQLTRDIHAPLANRLGIWQLKWELEDLAFRYLEPDTYRRIARLLDDKRSGREHYIEQVKAQLRAGAGGAGRACRRRRPPEAHLQHLEEDAEEGRADRRTLRPARAAGAGRRRARVLRRARRGACAVAAGARASSTTTSRGPSATTTARCTPR